MTSFNSSFNSSFASLDPDPYYGSHSRSSVRHASPLRAGRQYSDASDSAGYRSPFAVQSVSPAERRRLVQELRQDAHRVRTGTRPATPSFQSSLAAPPTQQAPSGYPAYGAHPTYVAYPAYVERTTHSYTSRHEAPDSSPEKVAERNLAELELSTERLRQLGAELMSFARQVGAGGPLVNGSERLFSARTTTPMRGTPHATDASMEQAASFMFPPPSAAGAAGGEISIMTVESDLDTPSKLSLAPERSVLSLVEEPSMMLASGSSPGPQPAQQQPYAPSGQTARQDEYAPPPAHVDVDELEGERARRKREFLAKRRLAEESGPIKMAGAPLVVPAARAAEPMLDASSVIQERVADVSRLTSPGQDSKPAGDDDDDEELAKARLRAAAAPASAKRPVVIPAPSKAHSGPAQSEPAAAQAGTDDGGHEAGGKEDARAARFERMAQQAAMLQAGGKSFALVPFGTFLAHQAAGAQGSYDDKDLLVQGRRSSRPPPRLPSDSSPHKKGRSHSMDQIAAMKLAAAMTAAGSNGDDTKAPLQQQQQPMLLEGFLFKSSGAGMFSGAKWRRRWFVLSGRLLVYMSSPASNEVGRMFDLNQIDVVTDPRGLGRTATPHAIGIQDHARRIILCAESHAEIVKWYRAIVLNVALLCAHTRPPVKSLAPPDRTKQSPMVAWRNEMLAKHRAALPVPPPPQDAWFYPHYRLPPSHYDRLGVPPDASQSLIKKAYYRLARESHPDRNDGVPQEDFAGISLAYDMLIDPDKRANYDLAERVKERLRQGEWAGGGRALTCRRDRRVVLRARVGRFGFGHGTAHAPAAARAEETLDHLLRRRLAHPVLAGRARARRGGAFAAAACGGPLHRVPVRAASAVLQGLCGRGPAVRQARVRGRVQDGADGGPPVLWPAGV
jgi:hypothetical protein